MPEVPSVLGAESEEVQGLQGGGSKSTILALAVLALSALSVVSVYDVDKCNTKHADGQPWEWCDVKRHG